MFSRDRITPVSIEHHFLPIKARIKYKICLLVHEELNFVQPKYLAELLKSRVTATCVELRSPGSNQLEEPVVSRLVSGERNFQLNWNSST